jgi:hypothetical protein
LHAWLAHGAGEDHWPSLPHVWTPAPEHCVAPGWHTPPHRPPAHAWFVHGTELPQAPSPPHVCTPLPEHCVAPGAHDPVQPPETHAWLPQGIGAPHWPVAAQATTALLAEHCVVPGAHGAPPSFPPSGAVLSAASPVAWSKVASSAVPASLAASAAPFAAASAEPPSAPGPPGLRVPELPEQAASAAVSNTQSCSALREFIRNAPSARGSTPRPDS